MTRTPPAGGYVFALVLVCGLGGLTIGLRWYSEHLDRISTSTLPAEAPSQAPSPTPAAVPAGPPPPSPEQIAGLGSSNPETQRAAALRLASLAMTAELEEAIRSANPAGDRSRRTVQCLRGRLPDLASLGSLIALLPSTDDAIWPQDVDEAECVVTVLSTRVHESPMLVVQALLPFAFSYPARVREPAVTALENAGLREIPDGVRRQLREGPHEGLAVRAAIALRADEIAPDLLNEWLDSADPKVRQTACQTLSHTPRPSAIRMLVRSAAEHPADPWCSLYLRDRQGRAHDVGPVLADQALDAAEPSGARLRALELLSVVGSSKEIDVIRPLVDDPDPQLKAFAEATAAALRGRQ